MNNLSNSHFDVVSVFAIFDTVEYHDVSLLTVLLKLRRKKINEVNMSYYHQIKSILVRGPFQYLSMSWSNRAPLRCAPQGRVLNCSAFSACGQTVASLPQSYHSPPLCPEQLSSLYSLNPIAL